jgi:hypothetical protein
MVAHVAQGNTGVSVGGHQNLALWIASSDM